MKIDQVLILRKTFSIKTWYMVWLNHMSCCTSKTQPLPKTILVQIQSTIDNGIVETIRTDMLDSNCIISSTTTMETFVLNSLSFAHHYCLIESKRNLKTDTQLLCTDKPQTMSANKYRRTYPVNIQLHVFTNRIIYSQCTTLQCAVS